MVSSTWRYVREKDKSLQKSLMKVKLSRLFPGWELAKMPSRDCLLTVVIEKQKLTV